MADACRDVVLEGKGIDLGSKDAHGLQYRYMDTSAASLTFIDAHPTNPEVIQADIESELPFASQTYDFVLMFYLLEHVYNYALALSEAARLLKPGGRIIGAVPQLERFHPDPDDYFRFTASGLTRALQDAGFKDVRLTMLGLGPFTAGAHFSAAALKTRVFRLPLAMAALIPDTLATSLLKKQWKKTFALSIYFEART